MSKFISTLLRKSSALSYSTYSPNSLPYFESLENSVFFNVLKTYEEAPYRQGHGFQ